MPLQTRKNTSHFYVEALKRYLKAVEFLLEDEPPDWRQILAMFDFLEDYAKAASRTIRRDMIG